MAKRTIEHRDAPTPHQTLDILQTRLMGANAVDITDAAAELKASGDGHNMDIAKHVKARIGEGADLATIFAEARAALDRGETLSAPAKGSAATEPTT